MHDAQLVIGRRIDVGGSYIIAKRGAPYSEVWQAWPSKGRVLLIQNAGVAAEPWDYVYWVKGWAAPLLMLNGANVLPFAILSADGTPLEMAVFASDK